MNEIIDFEKFKKELDEKKEKRETDKKIMKRLEERGKEKVSASINIETTQVNLLKIIKFIKELEDTEFKIKI